MESVEDGRRRPGDSTLWGLLTRKERWGLSWRGWLLLFGLGIAASFLLFFQAYPFLAVTRRVDSDVLVVEGWLREHAMRAAVEEWKSGHYPRIYSTGGPIRGLNAYTNDSETAASVGAELLKQAGAPADVVEIVPSRVMARDRTYSSAVALREWFQEHGVHVRNFNVMTEDLHARRTLMLYQKAFGDDVRAGIIAVPNPDYDARHWWRYSEGVRDFIYEWTAYLCVKFIFRPGPSSDG